MLTFATERLILRPRTLADSQACLDMDRDPEVTRLVPGPWEDPAAHRAFVEARTLGPWPAGMGYWTIESRDEPGAFLGWILLIPDDATGPEVEIGWRLPRRFWGRGIATEAARAILDHGFQTLGLRRIVAGIHPRNSGSISVAEKLGMTRDEPPRPDSAGLVQYSITRPAAPAHDSD